MSQQTASTASLRRLAVASCAGTTIEYYDFLAYAIAAATVFNVVFFPTEDPLVGTLLALGTFATGFLARPLGGILFGHFGDRLGRKKMLLITLVLMGVATVLIGLLPTYNQVGVLAPIALIVLRIVQGLAAGGEFAGAALIAIEHAPPGRKGFYGSWTILGVSLGALLASAAFAVLGGMNREAFLTWGWRIPFLASVLIAAVGMLVRYGISETPEFEQLKKRAEKQAMPFVTVLKTYPREVVLATGSMVGYSTFVYIVFTFLLSYGTQELGMSRNSLLYASIVGLGVQTLTIPWFASLSDRVGRRPVMLAGAVFLVLYPFVLFPLVRTQNMVVVVLALVLAYNGAAALHAPMAAFFAELFGTGVRYSGVGLGYQLGNVLGGGIAPVAATALYAVAAPSTTTVSVYAAAAAVVSCVCLLLVRNTNTVPARTVDAAASTT